MQKVEMSALDSSLDGAQSRPQDLRWALLLAAGAGGVVSVALGVYGHWHRPTGVPISTVGFATLLDMKSWLTTGAAALGLVQVVTAAGMWGRLPGVRMSPSWLAPTHRWSGAAAFLLLLPVAYHCLWSLGYQTSSVRVSVHSALGCAFFGLFATKMLALRIKGGLPSVALPLLGGALFGILAALWSTSSLWFFTQGR